MKKKLLPLALIAVVCEAMAQDTQCVRERAAMVENTQAYARSDLSLLGPQGVSEARENRKFIQAPSPEIWSETISGGEEVLAGKWGGLFLG